VSRVLAASQSVAHFTATPRRSVLRTPDTTTMGLGLRLGPSDEILTSEHDHYSTYGALAAVSAKSGTKVRCVRLYSRITYTPDWPLSARVQSG
jgi:selenocysteine lyase/cysteine desulfurase